MPLALAFIDFSITRTGKVRPKMRANRQRSGRARKSVKGASPEFIAKLREELADPRPRNHIPLEEPKR